MKLIKNVSHGFNKIKALMILALVTSSNSVFAALPSQSPPSQTVSDGDFIGLFKAYSYDIGIVIGLILGTLGFIVVSKNLISTYNEVATGKKTWGDMGMHGGMGVLLLVFIVYLLTEAAKILAA